MPKLVIVLSFSQPDIRVSSLLRRGLEKISGVRSGVWNLCCWGDHSSTRSLSTASHFFSFFRNVKVLLISSLHLKHEVQPWKLFALLSHPRSRLYISFTLLFTFVGKEASAFLTMHLCFLPRLTNFKGVRRLSRFLKRIRDPKAKTPDMKAPTTQKRVFRNPNKADSYFSGCNQRDKKTILFLDDWTFLDFLFFCFELNHVFEFLFLYKLTLSISIMNK